MDLNQDIKQASALNVLKSVWGYDAFRTPQDEIVARILDGEDAIALLPTGGGKSICFQVPGLILKGVCLVISPLLALQKDQVYQLEKRGVAVAMLNSSQSSMEQDRVIDKLLNKELKFLYLSPEKLLSESFQSLLIDLEVSFLAVDEAHCISQWGHDFRPQYSALGAFRTQFPKTPILALTATANKEVLQDIKEVLQIEKAKVFRKSFFRENILFQKEYTEDAHRYLINYYKNFSKESSIVYANSRKETEKIAAFLSHYGIQAEFYHGGLDPYERERKQELWTKNIYQVMVATNAFGMGIDKPDVRSVFHLNLPLSPEAYYQEAGRGGRDGKDAKAILLYNKNSADQLSETFEKLFPPKTAIVQFYNELLNFAQIAEGSMKEFVPINWNHFLSQFPYSLYQIKIFGSFLKISNSLEIVERAEEEVKIKVLKDKGALSQMNFSNYSEEIIDEILSDETIEAFEWHSIFSSKYATHSRKWLSENYQNALKYLKSLQLIDFILVDHSLEVKMLSPRKQRDIVTKDAYEKRKESAAKKLLYMQSYLKTDQCLSQVICAYFNERMSDKCGICSNCVESKGVGIVKTAHEMVLHYLSQKSYSMSELTLLLKHEKFSQSEIMLSISELMDAEKIKMDELGRLKKQG